LVASGAGRQREGIGMRIERRFFDWGVFFIALGAIPLAVQLGWLDQTTVGDAWRLWPVFLIAAGLGILLARSPFQLVGGLLIAVTLGLIIGGALTGGIGAIGCAGGGNSATAFPTSSGTFATSASIDLTINCGSAALTTTTGSGWTFSGSGDADRRPVVSSSATTLTIANAHGSDFFSFGAARSDWHLQLPTDPNLDLSLTMNAGTAGLNLAGARLTSLALTGNAGSVRIDLSNSASVGSFEATVNAGDVLVALPSISMSGSVTVNAGHVGFCAPPGAGLRFETSGAFSGNNFDAKGLSQTGDTWTSPDYATAVTKIDLQATVNAGSVELNPIGGCR
jgi:hypothetical protein